MILTIELSDNLEAALETQARAQGISAAGYARQILERALAPDARRPISAKIREIWSGIPDEVRSSLPRDGASQIDHYVYGLPKREP